jgi:thiol-disulfide isomerase/thioredoxin
MKARALLLACVLGTIPAAALAQDSAPPAAVAEKPATILTVGDVAPALTIDKWVRGEPITGFEKGKIYIVEFWATWCGPCIDGIPHLTELQAKYKDKGVTVIGVTSPDRRNTPEAVDKLVAAQNGKQQMLYTIAWDGTKATSKAYMKAAMQGGIPCAFLVDRDGRLAYIGHPMNMDDALAAVVKGDWDINKEKSRYEAEQAKDRRFNKFMQDLSGGNPQAAYAVAPQVLEDNKDDAGTLNMIAWTIVDPEGPVKNRDLAFALKAAERASELTEGKDASVLDTVSRVHFLKGDIDQAIQIQEKAITLTEDPGERAALKKSLDEYKAAKK